MGSVIFGSAILVLIVGILAVLYAIAPLILFAINSKLGRMVELEQQISEQLNVLAESARRQAGDAGESVVPSSETAPPLAELPAAPASPMPRRIVFAAVLAALVLLMALSVYHPR